MTELIKHYEKLTPMSLGVRRTVSFFQWASFVLFTILATLSIVEVALADRDPEAWLYDDEDESILNGFPFIEEVIPMGAYLSLQIAVLLLSVVAILIELKIYGWTGAGLDLSTPPLKDVQLRRSLETNALEQARRSFSMYGVAYENYFFLVPIIHATTSVLYVIQIIAQRQSSKFASVWIQCWITVAAYVIAGISKMLWMTSYRRWRHFVPPTDQPQSVHPIRGSR
jgi:hypothetical protein